MQNKVKNISAIIISICILSVILYAFLPKEKLQSRITEINYGSNSTFPSVKPIGIHSPFKGERISVIKLEGIISDSGGSSFIKDTTSSSYVLELINKATADPHVKGIVLRVNSPGGTVAASQELYQAVLSAKKKKPVVITMGDVAASGGYYIASAGNVKVPAAGSKTNTEVSAKPSDLLNLSFSSLWTELAI